MSDEPKYHSKSEMRRLEATKNAKREAEHTAAYMAGYSKGKEDGRAEIERLHNAAHPASIRSRDDRWREQAEKLAVALGRAISEKEDNDAPAIYNSETPFCMTEIAREALADFEAFKKGEK